MHRILALSFVTLVGCKGEDKAQTPTPKPTTPEPAPTPTEVTPPTPTPPAPAPTPAHDVSKIKFTGAPEDWTVADGKIELFVAVNESKFPVDNATFQFQYGFEDSSPTTDADFDKKSKVPGGALYESTKQKTFRYVLDNGSGPKIVCGGSLYRDTDYNKIPKERDAVIAKVKKVCATAKL